MRFMLVGVCLVLTVSGCGGSEMSLTEYVDQLNAINRRGLQQYLELLASPQGEVLVAAEAAQITDFTPQDLQVGLEGVIEIAVEVKEAADAIEPPEQVADLHHRLFDDKFTFFEEALAARAGTAANWEELSESPEMEAFRAAMAEDKQACIDFQAELDATANRAVFADTPWIPGSLKEIVDAVLNCEFVPEIPEDKQACIDFQAELDATADREVFADTPWIPGFLKEIVDAVLNCEFVPEIPEDLYRYPPSTSTP